VAWKGHKNNKYSCAIIRKKNLPDVFEVYKCLRGYNVQKLRKLVWLGLIGGLVKI